MSRKAETLLHKLAQRGTVYVKASLDPNGCVEYAAKIEIDDEDGSWTTVGGYIDMSLSLEDSLVNLSGQLEAKHVED